MPRLVIIPAFVIAAFTYFVAPAYAEVSPTFVKTKVTAVNVFQDRAEETKVGEAMLSAGLNRILVKSLPSGIQTNSIRVFVEADIALAVTGVNFLDIPVLTPSIEGEMKLSGKIEELEWKIKSKENSVRILSYQKQIAENLLAFSRKATAKLLSQGNPLPEDIVEKVQYLTTFQIECGNAINALMRETAKLRRLQKALKYELDTKYGSSRRTEKAVIVDIQSPKAVNAAVELKYLVGNCSWKPDYDFNFDANAGKAYVSYYALVHQNTGLDWDEAGIELSTFSPSTAMTPPALEPWAIAFARIQGIIDGHGEDKEITAYADSGTDENAPSETPALFEQQGELAVSFKIKGKQGLSTGSTKKFLIGRFEMPAKLKRLCILKLSQKTYNIASVTNNTVFPLLPGNAMCFVDGALSGNTRIGRTMPGRKLNLPLGFENRLKIKRTTIKDMEDERHSKIRHYFEFRIEVTNSSSEEMECKLKDRIPVSDNDDLRIKDVKFSEEPSERTPDGIISWNLKLGSGEKRIIYFSFYIEYPKESFPIGLEDI